MSVKCLEKNRPDITLGHENRYKCILIDVAGTLDKDIVKAELAKIVRCQDMVGQMRDIHRLAVQVVDFGVDYFQEIFYHAKYLEINCYHWEYECGITAWHSSCAENIIVSLVGAYL